MEITFTTKYLGQALETMGLGMLGIFIVLFVIYLVSVLLIKAFPDTTHHG